MTETALSVTLRQAAPIPLDVAFTCGSGDVLAIVGPSGSGKTTILRCIAGLSSAELGCVRVGSAAWLDTSSGTDIPPYRREVGMVFQDYALFPHLTALGNVIAALGNRPRSGRRPAAKRLLGQVHLSGLENRRPASLSGGERQRVALARALAREPAVLLLDEPFAAVDQTVRRRLQGEISHLQASLGIPLILVTHDFEDVIRLATHLLVLRAGRSVAMGSLQDVTSRPELAWLRDSIGLGSLFDATVARVDKQRGLIELDFDGGTLIAPHRSVAIGARARVRIPGREVILATAPPPGLSLHNVLPGSVSAIHQQAESDLVVVQLAIGGIRLLAEVTRDAVAKLCICEGARLYALVKSVSIDVQATGVEEEAL